MRDLPDIEEPYANTKSRGEAVVVESDEQTKKAGATLETDGDEGPLDGTEEGMQSGPSRKELEERMARAMMEAEDESGMKTRIFLQQDSRTRHGKTTTFPTISSSLRYALQARRSSSTTTAPSPLPRLLHPRNESVPSALQRMSCLCAYIHPHSQTST